jgi:hypothetical protein
MITAANTTEIVTITTDRETEIAMFELNADTVHTLGFTKRLTRELAYMCTEFPRISWEAEIAIKEMMAAGATKTAMARRVREIIGTFTASQYRNIIEVVGF